MNASKHRSRGPRGHLAAQIITILTAHACLGTGCSIDEGLAEFGETGAEDFDPAPGSESPGPRGDPELPSIGSKPSGGADYGQPSPGAGAQPSPPPSSHATEASECDVGRRIVELPEAEGAGCGALASWEGEPVFGDYCVYTHTGPASPSPAIIASFEAALGGVESEADCVVRGQGRPSAALAEVLDADYAARIGRLEPEALAGALPERRPAPVLIAVIDSADRDTSAALDVHGRQVAAISRDAAVGVIPGLDTDASYDAGAPSCERWSDSDAWGGGPRRIETFVGLPRDASMRVQANAGRFGYRTDLARAIVEAVECWRSAAPTEAKLVINLSVGWEPLAGFDGGLGEAMVIDALLEARCHGALVFAASGNREPLACVEGAVGPAELGALEIRDGCVARGLPARTGRLLEPVSAVDRQADTLANFRPGSAASLTAVGLNAIGRGARPGGPDVPMSGSSAATAVASGVAALVWSYFPELEPEDLVSLLHAGGETANSWSVAEIGAQAGHAPRKLTACRALAHACSSVDPGEACALTCPAPELETSWAAAYTDALADQLAPAEPELLPNASPPKVHDEVHVCDPVTPDWELWTPDTSPRPDPVAALIEPLWVRTQPLDWPCSLCFIDGVHAGGAPEASAYLSITDSEDFDPTQLRFVDITVANASGANKLVRYENLPLTKHSVYLLEDPRLCEVDGAAATKAYVSMTFDDGYAAQTLGNPIPVDCE